MPAKQSPTHTPFLITPEERALIEYRRANAPVQAGEQPDTIVIPAAHYQLLVDCTNRVNNMQNMLAVVADSLHYTDNVMQYLRSQVKPE